MQIKCEFVEVGEHEPAMKSPEGSRLKLGRYSGGNLNVEGYGFKSWIIVAYIKPDKPIKEYMDEGLTADELVNGCVEFLNQPPTKRSRKPRYGKLACNKFYILEDKISVSLITDQKNNKYFWGRGAKGSVKKYSKRGRPRKK